MKRRLTAVIVLLCIAAGLIPLALAGSSTSDSDSTIRNAIIGETIIYGNYEQDNNGKNGPEPIEWIVLDKSKGHVLVISKYVLQSRPYNGSKTAMTWDSCELREWLNDDFLYEAFDSTERSKIMFTNVTADKNGKYGTYTGFDTVDQIFLLSVEEALRYFGSINARQGVPTRYALACGAYTNGKDKHDGAATVTWWLRTPGMDKYHAASVNYRGGVDTDGKFVNESERGVRPVMWLDVSD